MGHRKALSESTIKRLPGGGLEFVISHEAPDLVGDVVVQRGLRPVADRIPAQVDHSGRMADLIGYWDNFKTHGDYTTATLHLVDQGISKMADLVRALSESGVKLAASIGFQAKSMEPLRPRGFKFKESTLHEVSVVVVPCQPLALQIAKGLGVDLQESPPEKPVGLGVDTERLLKNSMARQRATAAILAAKRTIKL